MQASRNPSARRSPSLKGTALWVLALALMTLGVASPVGAEEQGTPIEEGADRIYFVNSLEAAFESAAESGKPVMICINSQVVDGGRVEPAARALREEIYLDQRVVRKSREFVCAFITQQANPNDFGELRARFAIEGLIVSPQHIFVHPDGQTILVRREYWPFGTGERGVTSLLDMMDSALAKAKPAEGPPEAAPEGAPENPEAGAEMPDAAAPGEAEARAQWIAEQLELTQHGDHEKRWDALMALVRSDEEGDCTTPLIEALPDLDKQIDVLVDYIRALGVNGLNAAAEPIADYLKHKEDSVRGNAAVSLEHIGNPEVYSDILKRASREKDEMIANHMYRAAGRCGAGEKKVRSALVKAATGADSELASYGPLIGLAYFEGDKKTSSELEKMLKKLGHPLSGGAPRRRSKHAAPLRRRLGPQPGRLRVRRRVRPGGDPGAHGEHGVPLEGRRHALLGRRQEGLRRRRQRHGRRRRRHLPRDGLPGRRQPGVHGRLPPRPRPQRLRTPRRVGSPRPLIRP